MVEAHIVNRKGAVKAENISTEVLELLNNGIIETVNLTEWLAIDHLHLIETQFSDLGIPNHITIKILDQIKNQKKPSTMNIHKSSWENNLQ